MHTATRIAVQALPRIRALAPGARLCAFGLYAPMNQGFFRELGIDVVLGGEFEPGLVSLAQRIADGDASPQKEPVINLKKIPFVVPDRSGLPSLSNYASLVLADGSERTLGFTEASRGCKHLCRHCPVVPVYEGRFRIVPLSVIMEDIRAQAAAGARHISFGDPDFLNGPTHAMKVIGALHSEFPEISYDVTIKVEHVVNSSALLPELSRTGCLFVTTAVESVDDAILARLDKGHTRADFEKAAGMLRDAGISMAPTFVPFTPWTTLEGYLDLLNSLVHLRLVENVPPVQLSIRLLVPRGSYLLRIPGFEAQMNGFDSATLGYRWSHPDPRVDALQREVQAMVERAELETAPRRMLFEQIYRRVHAYLGRRPPALPEDLGSQIPHHSEPWYCCAEPTRQQLCAI